MSIEVRSLGLVPYGRGLDIQSEVAVFVADSNPVGVILALRHPPTITLGRLTRPEDVHVDTATLARLGIGLERVDRGGGATYHYPEQAVVYPILNMRLLGIGVLALLAVISQTVLTVFCRHGIKDAVWDADRPGVYVAGAKIASVGLNIRGDVCSHGLAVNVGQSTDGFAMIDPCRMPGLAVTSMDQVLGGTLEPDEISLELARELAGELTGRIGR